MPGFSTLHARHFVMCVLNSLKDLGHIRVDWVLCIISWSLDDSSHFGRKNIGSKKRVDAGSEWHLVWFALKHRVRYTVYMEH